MSVKENRAVIRDWFAGISAGDATASARAVGADYRMNGQPVGAEGAQRYSAMLLAAFPDWRAQIEELIAEGDRVAVRVTYSGTHQGDLVLPAAGRLAATGRRMEITSIELYRLAEGRVVEAWVGSDRLGLLQQLGVLPTPGQAGSAT